MPILFKRAICVLSLTTLFFTGIVIASEFQSLDEIRKSAADFAIKQVQGAGKQVTAETGYLDSRLRLPRCSQPLAPSLLTQQRNNYNNTVTIKCPGDKPWSVHVPVKISSYVTVYISNRPLPRGITIDPADLRQESRDISRLQNGYFENLEEIAGRLPKRSLPQGHVLSPNDLETHKIIRRGNKVTILATSGGITVSMPGKALDDAGLGDMVKIENSSSKRVIEAIVLRPGVVEVQM